MKKRKYKKTQGKKNPIQEYKGTDGQVRGNFIKFQRQCKET